MTTTTNVFQLLPDRVLTQVDRDWGLAGPGWYFSDEGEQCHGPYESRQEAEIKSCEYFEWLSPGSTVKQAPVALA